jgi:hypothetical protein
MKQDLNPGFQPAGFTIRYSGRSLRLNSPVHISPAFDPAIGPAQQSKEYTALYDTGATHSAISPVVVANLNLASIGARKVGVGGGELDTTSHLVNIILPNKVMFPMVSVAKMVLLGFDVIIGMDILGNGDFAVTHQNSSTTFSFCLPSRKEIDFVKEINSSSGLPRPGFRTPGRNSPCTCGSGKKYKQCHGR